jgi:hypothetical protein
MPLALTAVLCVLLTASAAVQPVPPGYTQSDYAAQAKLRAATQVYNDRGGIQTTTTTCTKR